MCMYERETASECRGIRVRTVLSGLRKHIAMVVIASPNINEFNPTHIEVCYSLCRRCCWANRDTFNIHTAMLLYTIVNTTQTSQCVRDRMRVCTTVFLLTHTHNNTVSSQTHTHCRPRHTHITHTSWSCS